MCKMNTVQVYNQELQIKEWDGQRVVTFKDIDLVHERPEGTAFRNFNKNKKHFIEDEDYGRVSSDEIRRMGIETKSNLPNGIYLITESGYLMLVKSFTDDLAWKVQRQLVNCYFRTKESVNIAIPELEPLTKVEWLKVCEYISSCPKHVYNALMIVVNKIAPKQFDFAEIRNESFGQGQNSDNFGKILRETLKNKKMSHLLI